MCEALGTALLVATGVGVGVFSYAFPESQPGGFGVGILGVALAVGASITVGAYAFGPVSGAHFNPAVTVSLAVAGQFPWVRVAPYVLAQTIGGALGASLIALVASSNPHFFEEARAGGFAANGFGAHSPGGFGILGAMTAEAVLSAVLVWIILMVTMRSRTSVGGPLAIGLLVTLLCLIAIPIDNASFNPARSFAAAIFSEPWAWGQLWVFAIFPLAGGVLGAALHRWLFGPDSSMTSE